MNSNEGVRVQFWLRHRYRGWLADDHHYVFDTVEQAGLTVSAQKLPNGMVEIYIRCPGDHRYVFSHAVSHRKPNELLVTITCHDGTARFYLNQRLVETVRLARPGDS
jgi:hypothetical protein